jgi:hypothetical protein
VTSDSFFIDFSCFHQSDAVGQRTASEGAAFAEALRSMPLWFAHPLITIFLTRSLPAQHGHKYDERAWCVCEYAWAHLTHESTAVCWPPIFDLGLSGASRAARPPPISPVAMARELAAKTFADRHVDLPLLIELHTHTTISFFRDVDALVYSGLGWSTAEVQQLCGVLPYCTSLTKLLISVSKMGDFGLKVLSEVMSDDGGALETLKELRLDNNLIGDSGIGALSEAAAGGALRHLNVLHLIGNRIADEGMAHGRILF